ncbi:helix-turn-helix domain-containing protein [Micromonospora endolithica]|uniref:AraC family transcriptional regulator n=1 Tax=Micromonospora endolithica TaxID=230091 RepID=A0A3A9ZLC3_9ACTN|nr:helix-turn-helix domain-containing protein [Micromonospora endolithica]RKN48574.1 AraC family transcriptional regulator [Micromonospora endolithica]TWJ22099.1 AraC-like DNA-binding protein [Micromonospora endolithica]
MATQAPLGRSFDSRDPDVIHDHLVHSYGTRLRITSGGAGYRLWHRRLDLGAFRLEETTQSGHLSVDVEGLPTVVVGEVRTATVSRACDGHEARFAPGDVYLAARPERACTLGWHPGRVTLSVLDVSLLSRVAADRAGRGTGPVRLSRLGAAPADLARHWHTSVAYLRDVFVATPDAAAEPLVRDAAARMLAAAVLTIFVPPDDPPIGPDRARGSTVRRAVAYMEENADRDIGVADVAAAVRATPRGLQLAFRRQLDVTPADYLRWIRLQRAHQDLLRSDPLRDTVAGIAHRWGYLSVSRFTARYRAVFGAPPSHTLRG